MTNQLELIEKSSVDELRAVQLERMRWSLNHAYNNVEFYRRKFDQQGIHPSDLNELSDLSKFPFTVKSDLREHYPFGLFAVPLQQVNRIHASSGTTGKSTVVGYTSGDIENWASLVARSIRAGGGKRGDILHNAYGYGLFTGGLGAHYGAEKLGCVVIPMSGGQTAKQVQLIHDFKPRIIMVTPSYCLNLVDEMERKGLNPEDCSIEIGIFGAEPWSEQMRANIEQRMGIQAVDIYGLSEIMGPGVAMECLETKDGPTVWEDHFYPEVINPHTGEVVPDGVQGELVFTTLTKEALPIIRYRTRDLTSLLPGTARTMRRISKITGRTDDMMIIRGVNVFPSQIEELILKHDHMSPHYQIELVKKGNLDEMIVRAEAKVDVPLERHNELAASIQKNIKDYIGISVSMQVLKEGGLPRSQGKAQRIVDNRH